MRLKTKTTRSRSTRTVSKRPRAAAEFQTLEDRRLLSATLSVSSSLLVFNAVNGTTDAQVETLTLTDTGSSALSLGSGGVSIVSNPANAGSNTRFSVVNASSIPASITAGGSFTLQLQYAANTVGIQSGLLQLTTNDSVNPVQTVTLNGIGTAGLGGSNQPSLARILQAYDIPTLVGEGPNDSNAATDSVYPNPPDASSQEVVMPRLVKAGSGPVTIQTLASFTQTGYAEPYTLGYYSPSNPNNKTELFFTPSNEGQSTYVQPEGSTQFDPGSTNFGFYFVSNFKDNGVDRVGYSEDDLNTWDTTVPRKFRFFPLENADGSTVANAYIMTSTEYNAPIGYDFTNIVAIVRNVMPATTAPALSLQPANPLPGTKNLIFSNIGVQNTSAGGDVSHNTNLVTVENTGSTTLTISSYTLSSNWQLVSPPTFPLSIAPDTSVPLTIKFVASTVPSHPYNETNGTENTNGGGVYSGSLVLNTNDPYDPVSTTPLAGWYQSASENNAEPSLQTLVNLIAGWSTNINPTPIPGLNEPTTTTAVYFGQETVSGNWAAADASRLVSVTQLAAYHTENDTAVLDWYQTGTTSYHTLFTQNQHDGQTIFPLSSSNTATSAVFTPTASFAWHITTSSRLIEDSVDSKNATYNTGAGHHMRFYPVVDASGNIVPDTYLLCLDYGSVPEENFDFQDNVYLISNIHPLTTVAVSSPQTTAAPAMPTDVTAVNSSTGISIEWAPVVSDTTLSGYNVYRSTAANGTFTLINTAGVVTGTSYFDGSAPSGSTSYYRITAVDASGAQSLGSAANATTASVVSPGTITGTIFVDNNGDGVYNSGDTPLSGWGVFVDNNNNGIYNASNDSRVYSNANGTFTFSNLAPGTYRISEMTPAGYNRTVPVGSYYSVTVAAGQAVTGKNFGVSGSGSISGTIFEDFNGNSIQDAGEPALAGWGCFIDYNDNGIFDGTDVRAYANASGVFTFGNIPAGTYFISQVTPTGWRRETPSVVPYQVTVAAGLPATVTFAEAQAAVYGTVFNDANRNGAIDTGEAGYAGFGVFIDNNGTGVFNAANDQRTFTDSAGNYRFVGLLPGTYDIQEMTPAGYTRITPGAGGWTITLTAGQVVTGENFGYIYGAGTAAQAAPAEQVASVIPTPKARPAAPTPSTPLVPATASLWNIDPKKKWLFV